MKRTLILVGIVVAIICSTCGYYIWCAYHPLINVRISGGSSVAENLKIDTPVIAVAGKWYADPASSIMLNINNFTMQHEYVVQYVKDTYKESNIKLDISEKNDKTVLNYTGTATTKDDQVVKFDKKITLEFLLNANITH
ncbi:hypothetical protein [Amedibacillus sp. YH-ame10]